MREIPRFFLDTQGLKDTDAKDFILFVIELAKSKSDGARIVFVSHGFQNDGWLKKMFNDDAPKKLKKGIVISEAGLLGKFESLNTYVAEDGDILVTLGLDSDDVLTLEDNSETVAIVAYPWSKGGVEKWARISGAIEIRSGSSATSISLPDCIVQAALTELTESINMATGISHPSDEEEAKTFIRALHGKGYRLVEVEIETFLIQNLGWEKQHANELLDIVRKINSGKTFHGGEKTGHKSYIDRWKKECEGKEEGK